MERVKIKLAESIYLDMPAHDCGILHLTTAIGMLSQMYMCAILEHDKGKKVPEKEEPNVILKNMMNAYIDEIYEKLKEN